MTKKNVLITGIGGDIGQSLIKCLNTTGYPFNLIGCDIEPYAAGRSSVKKFFQAPRTAETERYLEFIEQLIMNENIHYIFPSTEEEIEYFDNHRNYFDTKNVELFINKSNIIRTFLDKYQTVNFLKDNGFPYPRTHLLKDYNYELPFPLILKQRRGAGGRGLLVINNDDELKFYSKRTKDAIIQELIGNDDEEYTVAVFSSDKKEAHSISFKRRLGYDSLSKVAELVNDKELKELTEAIARVASLEGVLNIQLRKAMAGYVPIEINPRFSSTVYTRYCLGFKDVKWWIDIKEGRPINYQAKYKRGVVVRSLSEVFFDMDGF